MILHYQPKVFLLARPVNTIGTVGGWDDFLLDVCGKRHADLARPEDDDVSDAEMVMEMAGRLCYLSFGKGRKTNKDYLAHIIAQQHGSVLEHGCWTFAFTGVSRTLTHELVRHRIASYSQTSQRYVDEGTAEFVVPEDLADEVRAADEWLKKYDNLRVARPGSDEQCTFKDLHDVERLNLATEGVYNGYWTDPGAAVSQGLYWMASNVAAVEQYKNKCAYLDGKIRREEYQRHCEQWSGEPLKYDEWEQSLTQDARTNIRKRARQAARSLLPNCAETKIVTTMNARSLRHLLEMRGSRAAETEIRKLAYKVYRFLKVEAPAVFGDYEERPLPDGTVELVTLNRKV